MKEYKLPENILTSIKTVISRVKLDNVSFGEVFHLVKILESLEEIKDREENKEEKKNAKV